MATTFQRSEALLLIQTFRKTMLAFCAATALLSLPQPAFAGEYAQVVNSGTGKCLDVRSQDNYLANGAKVQQYHCTKVL